MLRMIYRGTIVPRLVGKSAILRDPDPAKGEPCEPYFVMAQFDDTDSIYSVGWWPMLWREFYDR